MILADLYSTLLGHPNDSFIAKYITVEIPLTPLTARIILRQPKIGLSDRNSDGGPNAYSSPLPTYTYRAPVTFTLASSVKVTHAERYLCQELANIGFLISRIQLFIEKHSSTVSLPISHNLYHDDFHSLCHWSLNDVLALIMKTHKQATSSATDDVYSTDDPPLSPCYSSYYTALCAALAEFLAVYRDTVDEMMLPLLSPPPQCIDAVSSAEVGNPLSNDYFSVNSAHAHAYNDDFAMSILAESAAPSTHISSTQPPTAPLSVSIYALYTRMRPYHQILSSVLSLLERISPPFIPLALAPAAAHAHAHAYIDAINPTDAELDGPIASPPSASASSLALGSLGRGMGAAIAVYRQSEPLWRWERRVEALLAQAWREAADGRISAPEQGFPLRAAAWEKSSTAPVVSAPSWSSEWGRRLDGGQVVDVLHAACQHGDAACAAVICHLALRVVHAQLQHVDAWCTYARSNRGFFVDIARADEPAWQSGGVAAQHAEEEEELYALSGGAEALESLGSLGGDNSSAGADVGMSSAVFAKFLSPNALERLHALQDDSSAASASAGAGTGPGVGIAVLGEGVSTVLLRVQPVAPGADAGGASAHTPARPNNPPRFRPARLPRALSVAQGRLIFETGALLRLLQRTLSFSSDDVLPDSATTAQLSLTDRLFDAAVEPQQATLMGALQGGLAARTAVTEALALFSARMCALQHVCVSGVAVAQPSRKHMGFMSNSNVPFASLQGSVSGLGASAGEADAYAYAYSTRPTQVDPWRDGSAPVDTSLSATLATLLASPLAASASLPLDSHPHLLLLSASPAARPPVDYVLDCLALFTSKLHTVLATALWSVVAGQPTQCSPTSLTDARATHGHDANALPLYPPHSQHASLPPPPVPSPLGLLSARALAPTHLLPSLALAHGLFLGSRKAFLAPLLTALESSLGGAAPLSDAWLSRALRRGWASARAAWWPGLAADVKPVLVRPFVFSRLGSDAVAPSQPLRAGSQAAVTYDCDRLMLHGAAMRSAAVPHYHLSVRNAAADAWTGTASSVAGTFLPPLALLALELLRPLPAASVALLAPSPPFASEWPLALPLPMAQHAPLALLAALPGALSVPSLHAPALGAAGSLSSPIALPLKAGCTLTLDLSLRGQVPSPLCATSSPHTHAYTEPQTSVSATHPAPTRPLLPHVVAPLFQGYTLLFSRTGAPALPRARSLRLPALLPLTLLSAAQHLYASTSTPASTAPARRSTHPSQQLLAALTDPSALPSPFLSLPPSALAVDLLVGPASHPFPPHYRLHLVTTHHTHAGMGTATALGFARDGTPHGYSSRVVPATCLGYMVVVTDPSVPSDVKVTDDNDGDGDGVHLPIHGRVVLAYTYTPNLPFPHALQRVRPAAAAALVMLLTPSVAAAVYDTPAELPAQAGAVATNGDSSQLATHFPSVFDSLCEHTPAPMSTSDASSTARTNAPLPSLFVGGSLSLAYSPAQSLRLDDPLLQPQPHADGDGGACSRSSTASTRPSSSRSALHTSAGVGVDASSSGVPALDADLVARADAGWTLERAETISLTFALPSTFTTALRAQEQRLRECGEDVPAHVSQLLSTAEPTVLCCFPLSNPAGVAGHALPKTPLFPTLFPLQHAFLSVASTSPTPTSTPPLPVTGLAEPAATPGTNAPFSGQFTVDLNASGALQDTATSLLQVQDAVFKVCMQDTVAAIASSTASSPPAPSSVALRTTALLAMARAQRLCALLAPATPLVHSFAHSQGSSVLSLSGAMHMLDQQARANTPSSAPPAAPIPPLPLHSSSPWARLRLQIPLPTHLLPFFSPSLLDAYAHLHARALHVARAADAVQQLHCQAVRAVFTLRHKDDSGQAVDVPVPASVKRKLCFLLSTLVHCLACLQAYMDLDTSVPLFTRFVQELSHAGVQGCSPTVLASFHEMYVAALQHAWLLQDHNKSAALSAICDAALSLCYDTTNFPLRVLEHLDVYEAYIKAQLDHFWRHIKLSEGGGSDVEMLLTRLNFNRYFDAVSE